MHVMRIPPSYACLAKVSLDASLIHPDTIISHESHLVVAVPLK